MPQVHSTRPTDPSGFPTAHQPVEGFGSVSVSVLVGLVGEPTVVVVVVNDSSAVVVVAGSLVIVVVTGSSGSLVTVVVTGSSGS